MTKLLFLAGMPFIIYFLLGYWFAYQVLKDNPLGADTSGYIFIGIAVQLAWPLLFIYSTLIFVGYFLWQKKRKAALLSLIIALIAVGVIFAIGRFMIGPSFDFLEVPGYIFQRVIIGTDCGGMKPGNIQDRCYYDQAESQCEASICQRMTSERNQNYCNVLLVSCGGNLDFLDNQNNPVVTAQPVYMP